MFEVLDRATAAELPVRASAALLMDYCGLEARKADSYRLRLTSVRLYVTTAEVSLLLRATALFLRPVPFIRAP